MKLDYAETQVPVTVAYLLKRFYRLNSYLKSEAEQRKGRNPIDYVINPAGIKHSDSFNDDVVIAPYYGSFFLKVEGNGILGPHRALLYFQIARGQIVHIGTAQIEGVLANPKIICKQLRKLIRLRRYYASEQTLAQIIYLPWDKCTPRMQEMLQENA